MTRTRVLLICLGLAYLVVPNLLFLAGWFIPPVAVGAGALLLFYTGWAGVRLMRQAEPDSGGAREWLRWYFLAAVFLFLVLYFLQGGIVGICKTDGDYHGFRQALFCNMRDAAWPVILPDGREMSYYLANILPPALLARVAPPAFSQWCVVLWTVTPIFLSVLLLLEGGSKRLSYAVAVVVALAVLHDPFHLFFPMKDGWVAKSISACCESMGWDYSPFLVGQYRATLLNPLHECVGAYNSTPPTLLCAAILLGSGRSARFMVPLVYSLLVAVSPIACIGLLPLAVLFYCRAWKSEGWSVAMVAREAPLPLCMLFLMAVYFTRAEGDTVLALTFDVWRSPGGWINWGRIVAGWLLLVLPLVRFERKNPLFVVVALYLLLTPVVFIGSGWGGMNELWLKSSPAYMMVLACFWVGNWSKLPKIKYVALLLCTLGALYYSYKYLHGASFANYGRVYDSWNGHLNHSHNFLKQSVPNVREPLVPGILLREAGASELQFPGNVLPPAPGCDYTRPAQPLD